MKNLVPAPDKRTDGAAIGGRFDSSARLALIIEDNGHGVTADV